VTYRDISGTITDEMLDATDDSRPCTHCDDGRVRSVTRNGDDIELCTECYHEADGTYNPPPPSPTDDGPRLAFDDERLRYSSGYVVMCGAHRAFTNNDDYGTDDGTASFEAFVTPSATAP
jgi:hypothetical protein